MIATVPAADTVDHNPLEAAKPLLLLGWTAPAALTARVALAQPIRQLADSAGLIIPGDRPTTGRLIVTMERAKVLDDRLGHRLMQAHVTLSKIAHGGHATLHEAARVIEAVERHLAELL